MVVRGERATMMYPVVAPSGDVGGPSGYTYSCVLVRLDGVPAGPPRTRAEVLAALREIRFSGWLAPPQDGWLVAVAASGDATIAAGRRGVVGVGGWLADRLAATVVAIRVVADRQLLLAAWLDREEVGRYVSDPSYGLTDEDDVLPDPLGVEDAAAFAAACGRPEAAGDLAELLAEQLDADSVIESERLGALLRLLRLPRWLVDPHRSCQRALRSRAVASCAQPHDSVTPMRRGRSCAPRQSRRRRPRPVLW